MRVSLLALRRQADNIEDAPRRLVRSMGEQCGRPQSRDLYLFLSSKHLILCRDTVTATVIPTAEFPLSTVRNGRFTTGVKALRKRIGASNVFHHAKPPMLLSPIFDCKIFSGFRAVTKFGLSVCNRRKVSIGLLVLGVVVLIAWNWLWLWAPEWLFDLTVASNRRAVGIATTLQ